MSRPILSIQSIQVYPGCARVAPKKRMERRSGNLFSSSLKCGWYNPIYIIIAITVCKAFQNHNPERKLKWRNCS